MKNIELPLIAVRGSVIFPYYPLVFQKVSETEVVGRTILAIEKSKSKKFVITTQINDKSFSEVGVVCELTKVQLIKGMIQFEYIAEARFRSSKFKVIDNTYVVEGSIFEQDLTVADLPDLDLAHVEIFKSLTTYLEKGDKSIYASFLSRYENNHQNISQSLLYVEAANLLPFSTTELLDLLRQFNPMQQVVVITKKLANIKNGSIDQELDKKTTDRINKANKEYILKEKMKTIQDELGKSGKAPSEFEKLKNKLKAAKLPKLAKEIAERELKRLEQMNSASSEYHVIENYLTTLSNYPWAKKSNDSVDLDLAKKILEDDHYGLNKVKKRIIQDLAVKKLTKKINKGSILCLAGPPGVGKTSICKSVAKSMNRKYIRIGLGGISDENEIRGHRKTYVGAMAGKIAKAMMQSKTNNPVIVLDEIDKVNGDKARGSVEAALLEVLDPEQNHAFSDHYFGTPIDLSNVMFIATANYLENISGPLRDRLEILQVSGYTPNEKLQIGERYLLPEVKKDLGLDSYNVEVKTEAIDTIIKMYTRESGVRQLKQKLSNVLRECVELVLSDEKEIVVDTQFVKNVLGNKFIEKDKVKKDLHPGMALGMAWTPFGGTILYVESAKMKGSGSIKLTGQLGDVMKESAQIAVSYIRENEDKLNLKYQSDEDIHIHFPDGSTPKDGPSAGVTLVTAIVSLLSDSKIRNDLSMTGEISLKGEVMPVGGIKEKLMAAYDSGVKRAIIPKANEKDLQDLPKEILEDKNFKVTPVSNVSEVLEIAFSKD